MPMIQLQGLGLEFPHKTCFSDFSATIEWGQRIAIVGDNGVGKTSLLRLLNREHEPDAGRIIMEPDLAIGYVEQTHAGSDELSGGQRVNRAISNALANAGDLLLLDEPTNHLDQHNRRALTRMLNNFCAGIVLVTHDTELMEQVCDTIWHIGNEKITVFHGRYADYLAQQQLQRDAVESRLNALKREQHATHVALMKEQERASHARAHGLQSIRQRKWATITSPTKLARGNTTTGSKRAHIREQRDELLEQLQQLPRHEIIVPQFHLPHAHRSCATVVQITDGSIGYEQPVIQHMHLALARGERLLLAGRNGCGKSTLARAIMGDPTVRRTGEWLVPAAEEIGYLDQHYTLLNPQHTVFEALSAAAPDWSQLQLRRHLSDFLFRDPVAVETPVSLLSGGEKARLALACIAARTPQLLILDEVTNNLDQRMRQHMVDILKNYPGALILISHDAAFLRQLGPMNQFVINSPSTYEFNSGGPTC